MVARSDLLVSDGERAQAVKELRHHYDAGRLTLDEFEERLAQAQAARCSISPRTRCRACTGATRAGARSRCSTRS
jgi:Domain of unknown function (DUF1707)